MEVLKVNSLYKAFGNTEVLNDISFNVNEGEVVSIVGPSGAGKSTLLKCIFNLEQADNGVIQIFDDYIMKDGKYASNKELKKVFQQMGFIFQDYNLFDNLNVYKNIALCMKIVQKKQKEEIDERITELLGMLNLNDKKKNYPSSLSGGEKQRVAIARALALNPKILFLDEPTSALDSENIAELIQIIKDLQKQGITMLIITHDIEFAKNVSSRIMMIEKGSIILNALREELDDINDERINKFLKMR